MVEALIFDLDDTLFDEVDYVRSGYRAVALALHDSVEASEHSSVESELWRRFEGGARATVLTDWLESIDRMDLAPLAIETYRRHNPSIRLAPSVRALLGELGERFKLGLITDGWAETQDRKIAALDVEPLLSTVVVSDTLGGREFWKPNPAPYLQACEQLAVDPSRAVYVGDNPHKDFQGARAAGMRSIRYRSPRGLHRDCEPDTADMRPDAVVEALQHVAGALSQLEAARDHVVGSAAQHG